MTCKGLHAPLVSEQVFRNVQLILNGKKPIAAPYKRNREDFPLRRFLRCSECNILLTGGAVNECFRQDVRLVPLLSMRSLRYDSGPTSPECATSCESSQNRCLWISQPHGKEQMFPKSKVFKMSFFLVA
jgi:hypothetical protein